MPEFNSRTEVVGPSSEGQVSRGLNLTLELEYPILMGRLLFQIRQNVDQTRHALKELHFVHFARFLPVRDGTALLVITEFDGPLDAYVLDFAIAIGDVFDTILRYVKDHPPLPVRDHPQTFMDFVRKNNRVHLGLGITYSGDYPLFSAYPDKTVIDIAGPRVVLPPLLPTATGATPIGIDLYDVQGNILYGYKASIARHFAVRFNDAGAGRNFLGVLMDGDELQCPRVTSAARQGTPWLYCLNVGVTADGLGALGVSHAVRARLPLAFLRGPADAECARFSGDVGASAPSNWEVGGPHKQVHVVVSLYADATNTSSMEEFDIRSSQLKHWWHHHGGTQVVNQHDAHALPNGKVHFGYRDGMAQPRVAGVHPAGAGDVQPQAHVGEFLLGRDYPDIYGGTSLKSMPRQLCQNATFAAVRILDQDVTAFEALLDTACEETGADREWIAAKLMGRWRDGTPLSLDPSDPAGGRAPALEGATDSNAFDYAPSHQHPHVPNDHDGMICPVGSHMRRMNPRGALVAGRPYSRRLVRRGMPYGPAWDPLKPDHQRRGLYGIFLCADLERQFEFLMQEWANRDTFASGIRGTQDPIIGAQDRTGEFLIPLKPAGEPIKLKVPRLVTTRGSLYLLLPGIEGLRFLAHGESASPRCPALAASVLDGLRSGWKAAAGPEPVAFDPKEPAFLANPYPYYAAFRKDAPVSFIKHGAYESFWVFSHKHITTACEATDRFLKQGRDEKGEKGLFFMDPPMHTAVRDTLDPLFGNAIEDISTMAQAQADVAIKKIRAGESVFDAIPGYSNRVTRNVFMDMFGLPQADWDLLTKSSKLPEMDWNSFLKPYGLPSTNWNAILKSFSLPDVKWKEFMKPLGLPDVDWKWLMQPPGLSEVAWGTIKKRLPRLHPDQNLLGSIVDTVLNSYDQMLPRIQRAPVGVGMALLWLYFDRARSGCPAATTSPQLLCQMAQAARRGPPLTGHEVTRTSMNFAIGGYLSTDFLVGTALHHLLSRPAARAEFLAGDASWRARATQELLRFDAPFQMADRFAAYETELGGCRIPAGSRVTLVYGSANRDESVFGPKADQLDLKRDIEEGTNYVFGHGIHRCIGASMAERVAPIVIGRLLEAFPDLALSDTPHTRYQDPYFRGFSSLTLRR